MTNMASCPYNLLQPDWGSDIRPRGLVFPQGLDRGSVQADISLDTSLKHHCPSVAILVQPSVSQDLLAQNPTPQYNPVTPQHSPICEDSTVCHYHQSLGCLSVSGDHFYKWFTTQLLPSLVHVSSVARGWPIACYGAPFLTNWVSRQTELTHE